jgi:hypothetical protein
LSCLSFWLSCEWFWLSCNWFFSADIDFI